MSDPVSPARTGRGRARPGTTPRPLRSEESGGRPPSYYSASIPSVRTSLSDEAGEVAVLGCLLLDMGDFDVAPKVFAILAPDDFHRDRHKMIAAACLALYQAKIPLDLITVQAELLRRGHLEACGGSSYLAYCIAETPTSIHALYYAKIVEHWAEERARLTHIPRSQVAKKGGYHGIQEKEANGT